MGNCLCKNKNGESQNNASNGTVGQGDTIFHDNMDTTIPYETPPSYKFPTSTNIDKLVLEILGVIGMLVDK